MTVLCLLLFVVPTGACPTSLDLGVIADRLPSQVVTGKRVTPLADISRCPSNMATLRHHVGSVVSHGPDKKVVWANTPNVVAVVADDSISRHVEAVEHERYPTRTLDPAFRSDDAIPVRRVSARPQPARFCLGNSRPESAGESRPTPRLSFLGAALDRAQNTGWRASIEFRSFNIEMSSAESADTASGRHSSILQPNNGIPNGLPRVTS